MKINLSNPRYNIAFINCDGSISHANSKVMRLISSLSKQSVEGIVIVDHNRIKFPQSYKCIPQDRLKNKAMFESSKYALLYKHLNIGYYRHKIDKYDVDTINNLFSLEGYSIGRANIIIVTSSTTDIDTVEQIKEITNNSPYGTFIHLHVETGNNFESGAVYSAMSQRFSAKVKENNREFSKQVFKVRQPYTSEFKYLDVGDLSSNEMLEQCSLGGTTLALVLSNIICFDLLDAPVKHFNINSMSIGQDLSNKPPMKPIKLLQPKKTYKKRGKNKKSKKSSNKIHIVIGGTGGTGTLFTSEIFQQLAQNHDAIGTIVLADGDIIEAKNLKNQVWRQEEVGMFKADALAKRYKAVFPQLDVKSYNKFIYDLNEDILQEMLGLPTLKDATVVFVGAFDNTPIRQKVYNLFRYSTKCRNFLWVDSGNGTDIREGQTVMGYKQYGKVILDSVATCGIDNGAIINNTEEISDFVGTCARIVDTHPQNITTNILAARSLTNHVSKVIMHREIHAHFSVFYLEPVTILSGAPIK